MLKLADSGTSGDIANAEANKEAVHNVLLIPLKSMVLGARKREKGHPTRGKKGQG